MRRFLTSAALAAIVIAPMGATTRWGGGCNQISPNAATVHAAAIHTNGGCINKGGHPTGNGWYWC